MPAPDKIVDLVCDACYTQREQQMRSRCGRENQPRDVAIYLVRRYSGKTLAAMGNHFGLTGYSTVSMRLSG